MTPRRTAALLTSVIALCCAAQGAPPPLTFNGAKWIWFSADPMPISQSFPGGVHYFRGAVTLPAQEKIVSADLLITADNLYTVYINGKLAGESSANPNDWKKAKRFDVKGMLVPGRNVVAVEAVNTIPGRAGLLVKLVVRPDGGKGVTFVSSDAWMCVDKQIAKWQTPAFDDKAWSVAHVVGGHGVAPWGKIPVPPKAQPGGAKITAARKKVQQAIAKLKAAAGKSAKAAPKRVTEIAPPADYAWPKGIVFLGDDCSLYRPPKRSGSKWDSLTVTIFNPRGSRAFPEHDLPAPMKVGHKLYALAPARPGVKPRVLLDAGKGGIGSPSVSFDGKSIYVSMAPEGEGFFHIHRVGADGGKPQKLTDGPFHDIDPAELPDGRIVFTSTRIGTFEEYHAPPSRSLFVMNADGSDIRPLTHSFIFDNEPEVMADGRILFIRTDNFFDRGKVETLLHAVHPDGTEGYTEFGLDLGPDYGRRLRAFYCGSPAPMPDGRVAYVSRTGIAVGVPGCEPKQLQNLAIQAGDVAALPDGRLICTVLGKAAPPKTPQKGPKKAPKKSRPAQVHTYEKIGILDPDNTGDGVVVLFRSTDGPLHSPVYLGPRVKPPRLADKVDPKEADKLTATGILFCRDARFTRNTTAGWPHVRSIRVLAGKGLTVRSSHSYIVHAGSEVTELGTVPLAPDGSFAVEVPADTAIAFQAVDAEGRSELNEMSWIYVRPGEVRGCVGCHAPRQAAPPAAGGMLQGMRPRPLKLLGRGDPHRFRGNNAAVTGLMELQFDRYREVAALNRHAETADPSATGPQEVAALIAQLQSRSEAMKISAAQRLAVFRDPAAAKTLAIALHDPSREVRVAAATALAACGTRESVPPLLDTLSDLEPHVAQAAVVALENLTGHAQPFNAFVPQKQARQGQAWRDWFAAATWERIEQELVARLQSDDRNVVRRAAVTLGHVGGDKARAALRDSVTRLREDKAYVEWRKKHRGDRAQFNSLAPVNPRTAQAAIRSLGYLKDAEATALLTEVLAAHSDPAKGNLFLAEAAAEALGRIATPQAEAALIDAFAKLKDYPTHTNWYGDHTALMACHAAPIHYFITEALDAMGTTKAGSIVPHLIRSVPTDTDRALFPGNDDCEALIGRVIRRSGAEARVVETCLAMLGEAKAERTKEIEDAVKATHTAWGGKPGPENRAAQVLSLVCRTRAYEPRIRAAFDRYRAKTNDIPRVFDTGIPKVTKLPVKHWVCFFLARTMGNLADPKSTDALIAALQAPPEAATGYPDPLGPGVLFLHNDLTPCWRAASAWALGRIGDRRATAALLAVVGDLKNATDTRHAAAEALQRIADPASLQPMRKLAEGYPEVSTRRALLRACVAAAGER